MGEAQQRGTERLPLEIVLIGALSTVFGLMTALSTAVSGVQFAVQRTSFVGPSPMLALFAGQAGISYVLALAGIVVGIGLLHYAVWARRDAVILIYCLAIPWSVFLVTAIWHVVSAPAAPMVPGIPSAWGSLLRVMVDPLPYLAALLCLESPRIRTLWQDDARPGRVARWSAALWQRIPANLAPVTLIAGIQLCCWSVSDISRYWSFVTALFQVLQAGLWVSAILQYLPFFRGVLLLLAAVLLFTRTRPAHLAGIAVLSGAILLTLLPCELLFGHVQQGNWNDLLYRVNSILTMTLWVLRYGIMAVLLFAARPAPPMAAPPSEVALDAR